MSLAYSEACCRALILRTAGLDPDGPLVALPRRPSAPSPVPTGNAPPVPTGVAARDAALVRALRFTP